LPKIGKKTVGNWEKSPKIVILTSTPDLNQAFPTVGSTIRQLTLPDAASRPSASELLSSTFSPLRDAVAASKCDDVTLARLEDENQVLYIFS
jgi:hypothetical protein